MVVVEYYLFRDFAQLLHKDPGLFPVRVGKALEASRRGGDEVVLINGYGPWRFLTALAGCWARPSGHVAILFHLNLRTGLFVALARCFSPRLRVIIKTDLTPVPMARLSVKQKLTWRAVAALSRVLCVETPEGLDLLKAIGIQNVIFLPNHIDIPKAYVAHGPSAQPRAVLVTREGDDRKRPGHTLKVAQALAAKGWEVLLVGMAKAAGAMTGLTLVPSLEKEALMEAIAGASAFVGLSETESYWFVVAEAVAMGIPVLCTPTGIAPFLATNADRVELVHNVWDVEDMIERLHRLVEAGRGSGFNINTVADQQMAHVVEGLLGGENV